MLSRPTLLPILAIGVVASAVGYGLWPRDSPEVPSSAAERSSVTRGPGVTVPVARPSAMPAPGEVLDASLAGGEAHAYRIDLETGQHLRITVEQRGIDVVLRLVGPGGELFPEIDSLGGARGPEVLSAIAGANGDYRLEVRAPGQEIGGSYRLAVAPLLPATSRDVLRVKAERRFAEGEALRRQGSEDSFSKAREKYLEALDLWRELADSVGRGEALGRLGWIDQRAGRLSEARALYEQALPLLEDADEHWRRTHLWLRLGRIYRVSGEVELALDANRRAQELCHDAGDRGCAASALNNLALNHKSVGEFRQALEAYQQALALRRGLGDIRSEARILHNLGQVYLAMDKPRPALDAFRQALLLKRRAEDLRSEAATVNSIATAHLKLSELAQAHELYEQALELRRELGDEVGEAVTLTGLGHALWESGEVEAARGSYQQAVAILSTAGDLPREAEARAGLARAWISLGELDAALEEYRRGLPLFERLQDRGGQATVFYGMAWVFHLRGELGAARDSIEAALQRVESVRSMSANADLRASFFASRQDYYELHIAILMDLHHEHPDAGYDRLAFEAAERRRARGLLETLAEARGEIRAGASGELWERQQARQRELNTKERQRARLLATGASPEKVEIANRELRSALAEYRKVREEVRLASPRYTALAEPQVASVEEIRRQCLDRHTVLLSYSLGEQRSFLWLLTPESLASYVLPERSTIAAVARRVHELMASPGRRSRGPARLAAAELSEILLTPVADRLGDQRLLIVGDGSLQYVPFAALPDPRQRGDGEAAPLVVRHEIVALPSASVLVALQASPSPRGERSGLLAVVADPVFRADDSRLVAVRPAPGIPDVDRRALASRAELEPYERLPFSRLEAEAILALRPEGKTFVAMDFSARRQSILDGVLADYEWVHFATHGVLDTEHPELSGVVLSLLDERGRPVEGFLRAHDIYNLRLPAELVVLSACQTALGRQLRGEGMANLTRAFMVAGARRVMVSLWSVRDRATAELMEQFYRGLLIEELSPAAALRSAQLSMLADARWREPQHWAGFVLQGLWR